MVKKHVPEGDPFADLKEWQDHRYDPGYFTGGRIHPLLKAARPNRYGWVLLTVGLIVLGGVLSGLDRETPPWQFVGAALFCALYVVAGVKLLRRRSDTSR